MEMWATQISKVGDLPVTYQEVEKVLEKRSDHPDLGYYLVFAVVWKDIFIFAHKSPPRTVNWGLPLHLFMDRGDLYANKPSITWYANGAVRLYLTHENIVSPKFREYLRLQFGATLRYEDKHGRGAFYFSGRKYPVTVGDKISYIEADISDFQRGYFAGQEEGVDQLTKVLDAYQVKVLDPINDVVRGKEYAFPLPRDIYGNRKLRVSYHDRLNLFSLEHFVNTDTIRLKYEFTVREPLCLEAHDFIRGNGGYPGDLPRRYLNTMPLGYLSETLIRSLPFRVLSSVFGRKVLPRACDFRLYHVDGEIGVGGAVGGTWHVMYTVSRAVTWSATDKLFQRGVQL